MITSLHSTSLLANMQTRGLSIGGITYQILGPPAIDAPPPPPSKLIITMQHWYMNFEDQRDVGN